MAALDQALVGLQASVGAETSSAIVRRLIHVPDALDWLADEPVRIAVADAFASNAPLPAAALLAATGHASLSSLPEVWPHPLAARREALLSGQALGEPPSPDDVLILAGELLQSDRTGGADDVVRRMGEIAVDWRAPLAVAWSGLSDPEALAARIAGGDSAPHLGALVSALRAGRSDDEAAGSLAAASGPRLNAVLHRLVEFGDPAFASAVAFAADHSTGADHEGAAAVDKCPAALRRHLQEAWEMRRGELAALTDALAEAAAYDGDSVTEHEARRQALQLGPSDARLANVAISVAEDGDASSALALLPPSATTPPLEFAAGLAYLRGGAIEKGRAILVESALSALETGEPKPSTAMAEALKASGETALALDVYRAILSEHPSDIRNRGGYAQVLADTGDNEGALAQARLVLALDRTLISALAIEAGSLRRLGRPREALSVMQAAPASAQAELWMTKIECAIDLADRDQAETLLAHAPADVPEATRIVLAARAAAAAGRGDEAVALLEAATLKHPAEHGPWLALARLHADQGDVEGSFVTLRRAASMIPGSPRIHAALAEALRTQGRPSEALAEARVALKAESRDPQANLEAGLALMALARPAEAVDPLRVAYRRSPGDLKTRLALAEACGATGDILAARSLVAHLPETAPAQAWMVSGRLELMGDAPVDAGRARAAAARLLRARSLNHQDPALPLWLGRAFEGAGDAERAAEAYAEYLRSGPRDPDQARFAALHKAQCRLQAGDTFGAIEDFEALRRTEGEDRRFIAPLAHAYRAASLFDDATRTAEALLDLDAADRDGLETLSSAARHSGDWRRAAQAHQKAAEKVGNDTELWLTTAESALAAADTTLATTAVEKAMAGLEDAALLRRAAHVLVGLGQPSHAAGVLKSVVRTAPGDAAVWIELADVCEASGDPTGSIEALNHATDLSPWDVELQGRRAAALWTSGRHDESLVAWQKTHELAPQDVRVQRMLARALVDQGQVEPGLNLFARALEGNPTDSDLLSEAGFATLAHGSPQEAVDLLQRAAAVSPAPNTLAALGEAWLRLGQPERAVEVLRRATSLPGATTWAWAVTAEAAISTGELTAAEEAILEARRPDALTPEDRIALSRAELRLANWSDALTALAPILSTGEVQHELKLAEMILRVLEARWVFADAALARRHAPGPDVPSESLMAWVETFLAGADESSGRLMSLGLRLRLARVFDDDEALAGLRKLVSQEAADDATSEALAIALLRRQRPSEALEVLRLVHPSHLGSCWQALLAGIAHLQGGNPSLARQALVDASDDAGLCPFAQAMLARAHLAQGYSDSAVTALNAALSRWPDEPAWHEALADLYLATADYDAALPHLQSAVEFEPEHATWRLTYARALRGAGHLSDALAEFERVLPLMPAEAQVWHEAGDLALLAGAAAQAEAHFDRAASLDPENPIHLVGKAQAALAGARLRDARRSAENAIRLGGERSDALQCLAEVAAKQGETERAIELLNRAQAVAHDETGLRRVRTRLLIELDRAGQAALELREHLAGNPEDDEAWPSLADALEATGDYPAAGQALEAALRLRPRSADLHVQLARIERKSGQLDRALDLLRQAETIDPLQGDLALEFGQVYEARRELDHALDAYCRATEVNPRAPDAFRRAGHVFKSLKAYAEAEAMLQRAADLDPTDTATLQQLAAVRALELVHGGTYRMAVNP